MKYERRKGEAEVTAEQLLNSDWFSSIQQTFLGSPDAVRTNQFLCNMHLCSE